MKFNIKDEVKQYLKEWGPNEQREFDWFRTQPNLESAIKHAALATNEQGRMYTHQSRTGRWKRRYPVARQLLHEKIGVLEQSNNFDGLHDRVDEIFSPLKGKGIADLYVYDTALRIGFYRKLMPKKVYLHRGTRDGARILVPNLADRAWFFVSELPQDLQRDLQGLEPYQIENFFCWIARKHGKHR